MNSTLSTDFGVFLSGSGCRVYAPLHSPGSRWLARTTSITELMLNCVALEAVLHVDEFIFTALVPTNLQLGNRVLEMVDLLLVGLKGKPKENDTFLGPSFGDKST